MLHGLCAQIGANLLQKLFTQRAVITEYAHFDQFMSVQIDRDLADHRVSQAVVADHDNRVEMMGKSTQVAALISSEFHFF